MKTLKRSLIVVLALGVVGLVSAGPEHEMKPYKGSEAFEKMKSLTGTWKGTSKMKDMAHPAEVTYRVTANGSAVVENLFPGSQHEMVSIYHEEKGKLVMTHYCALGNQPKLKLKKASKDQIDLVFAKKGNVINHKKDWHMHSVSLEFKGENEMTQTWTSYKKGKKDDVSVVTLVREATPTPEASDAPAQP